MKAFTAACLAGLLAIASPASAQFTPSNLERLFGENGGQFWTGEEIYRRGTGSALLMSYVAGIHDANLIYWTSTDNFCVPAGATTGQLADVAFKYLQENPQDRHRNAAFLVRESFRRAWPCPSK